jgi:hypothetical protein
MEYEGKLEPGLVSMKGTETRVTAWLIGGADVSVALSVGGGMVGVGIKTVKVASQANRKRIKLLIHSTLRLCF